MYSFHTMSCDCPSCLGETEKDPKVYPFPNGPEILESYPKSRVVVARKERGTNYIRKGDLVRVDSWFTYEEGGPRLRYYRQHTRLSKGPNWPETATA